MASASQAECQQFDPGQVYVLLLPRGGVKCTSPKEAHLQSYGKKRHTLLIGAQMENNKGQERLSKTTKGRRGCRKQERAGEAGEKDKGQERLSKTTKDKRGGRKRERAGESVENDKGQERPSKATKGRRGCSKQHRAGDPRGEAKQRGEASSTLTSRPTSAKQKSVTPRAGGIKLGVVLQQKSQNISKQIVARPSDSSGGYPARGCFLLLQFCVRRRRRSAYLRKIAATRTQLRNLIE